MDFAPLDQWPGFQVDAPYIVAGPCSAETRDQVLQGARALAPLRPLFRAGLWKPRTRPNSFEGVGEKGLPWLVEVKERFGLPVACEVARASHVEMAEKFGVDVVWLGARTMGNPFSVQEIADALQGSSQPVMVKNPLSADLPLWIGGIERLYRAGIRRLAAVHRGFSSEISSPYRNRPIWRLPLELRRRFPGLPLLCDPSHMAGKREMVGELSFMAMGMGVDGLMIEVHPDPKKALSDSSQQLTPESLGELLEELKARKGLPRGDKEFFKLLHELREKIDEIDEEILQTLYRRFKVVHEIGKIKGRAQVRPFQIDRMEDLMKERIRRALALGLSESYVNEIFQIIHAESVRLQAKL